MIIIANDQPGVSAATLARDMLTQGVSRRRFVVAIDEAGEEMARTWRMQGLAISSIYRVVRQYRSAALEEFDRITSSDGTTHD